MCPNFPSASWLAWGLLDSLVWNHFHQEKALVGAFSSHCEILRGPVGISSTNGAVTAGRNLVSRSHNIFPDTATFGRPGAGRGGWSEPHLSTTNVQHFVTVTEQWHWGRYLDL